MSHEQTLALLDEWINVQRTLLARTNADLAKLQEIQRDPLGAQSYTLNPLPQSPPKIPWDWSAFDGRDCTSFRTIHHRTHASGPRPLSEFVHNAKIALLNPIFEKWNLDWDPPPLPPRKDVLPKKHLNGLERSVVSYLTSDAAGEAADVDIDVDLNAPPDVLLPIDPPSIPPPLPGVPKRPDVKPRQKKKRKREPSPSHDTDVDAAEPLPQSHPTHATKAILTSSKPPKKRSETFKQSWSDSEQNLLERLLEQFPEGEKNRWKKISQAMGDKRTPRQVASRVQKYFAKLQKFGLG